MLRRIIFLSLFCAATVVFSSNDDIVSDLEQEDVPCLGKGPFLSGTEEAKAQALGHFAVGFLTILDSNGFGEKAEKELLETVDKDPDSKFPITVLTSQWYKNSEYDKWAQSLLPLAKKHPESAVLNLTTATALMILERYAEAAELLRSTWDILEDRTDELKEADDNYKNVCIFLLTVYGKLGLAGEGDEIYSAASLLPKVAGDIDFRRAAVVFYSACAEKTPADGLFDWTGRRYRRLFDENLAAYGRLWDDKIRGVPAGKGQVSLQDMFSVLEVLKDKQMFESSENLVLNVLLGDPENLPATMFLAKVYSEAGQHNISIRLWRKIAELRQDTDGGMKPEEAYILYELGREQFLAMKLGDAEKTLASAVELDPSNKLAAFYLGVTYMETQRPLQAIDCLARIDGIPEAKYFLASCYGEMKQYDKSVKAMEEAEALAKEGGKNEFLKKNFYLSFANFCDKAKQLDKALRILRNLFQKFPDDAEVANFLGYTLADNGKELEEAERLIRMALEKEPDNAAFLDSMAWTLYRMGRHKEALEYMKKALEMEGDIPDPVIADHTGDIHKALGNNEMALKYWKMSLGSPSNDLDRAKVIEKIRALEPAFAE